MMIPSSFFARVIAYIIDVFLVVFLLLVFIYFVPGVADILGSFVGERELENYDFDEWKFFLIMVGYHTLFEVSPIEGSPGKWLVHARVANEHKERMGIFRALFRNLLKYVSFSFCLLGILLMFFTEDKQCFHDLLTSSFVIERNSA